MAASPPPLTAAPEERPQVLEDIDAEQPLPLVVLAWLDPASEPLLSALD